LPGWLLENGQPNCQFNPAIDKNGGGFGLPDEGSVLRALVLSILDTTPIPDGSVLFTCTYEILPDATPDDDGHLTVYCRNALGSTPDGVAIAPANYRDPGIGELACTDGAVDLDVQSSAASSTPTPARQVNATQGDRALRVASGDDGCQLDSEARPASPLALALPLLLVLVRRLRRVARF